MGLAVSVPKYRATHIWVQRHFGKPNKCSNCGFESGNSRQFHWANLSGLYLRDFKDWKRLCVGCHMRMDRGQRCLKGHIRTSSTSYTRPSGKRECRICKVNTRKTYKRRVGL